MNPNEAYNVCCRHHGKRVRITCKDGREHFGRITRIDRDQVWIQPDRRFGGYGLGFWGGGFGFGGFGFGIALGAIAGIALAPLFFF
ncbi:hypothetical protein ACIQ2D_11700 [Lysinibacillus sp. NPDC097287]|uniref:hypothetical protein n=1 Tax=Lysinibacillus sp. NPDC097287 TaxID=3364144 RepID=UPI00380D3C05